MAVKTNVKITVDDDDVDKATGKLGGLVEKINKTRPRDERGRFLPRGAKGTPQRGKKTLPGIGPEFMPPGVSKTIPGKPLPLPKEPKLPKPPKTPKFKPAESVRDPFAPDVLFSNLKRIKKGFLEYIEVAGMVEAALLGIVAAGALAGASFAKLVIENQAQKEALGKALAVLLKSEDRARQVMALASQTAQMIGESTAVVAGQFVDLLAKGFDVATVDTIIKRLADLSVVDPKANVERLTLAISQIASLGKLAGQEINQLAQAGLERISIFDALAKKLGKTREEVDKLQRAGKITADIAIPAILEAIAEQTGQKAPGVVAMQKSLSTITGVVERIKRIPENILFDLDVGPGLDSVRSALVIIDGLFSSTSKSGQALREALTTLFNAIIKGFFGVEGLDKQSLEETIVSLSNAIIRAAPKIQEFFATLRQIFDITLAIGKAAADLGVFSLIGTILQGIAFLILQPVMLTLAWITVLGQLWEVIVGIWDSITGFFTSAFDLGGDIIDGLTQGISSGASSVVDAISSTVMGAIDSAKALLGIASPSKVFEQMGAFTSEGFAMGMSGAPSAQAAMNTMLTPPAVTPLASMSRGGGAATTTGDITVMINGVDPNNARAVGEAARKGILDALLGEINGMAIAANAAGP